MDGSDMWVRVFVVFPMAGGAGGVAAWTASHADPGLELVLLLWIAAGVEAAFVATCWALGLSGAIPTSRRRSSPACQSWSTRAKVGWGIS